jgi:hypothetical protein
MFYLQRMQKTFPGVESINEIEEPGICALF